MARRGRAGPAQRALAIGAPALVVLLIAWGCTALRAPMPLIPSFVPDVVALDQPLPALVRSSSFVITGTTHPNALVLPTVDTTVLTATMAEADGRFAVKVPLTELGTHDVRLEIRYRMLVEPPAEVIEGRVARAPFTLPPPRLLAVQFDPAGRPGVLRILVATTPGTEVTARGASLKLITRAGATPWGRLTYDATLDDPAQPLVRLVAHAEEGVDSVATAALDLVELATAGVAQDDRDVTDATIVYAIDRFGISRTQSVELAPNRPELTELTVGRLDALGFLQSVAGQAGLAPGPGQPCALGRFGSALPDVQIGTTASVTFEDTFPDFVTNTNGFADRPELSLCFPEGLPAFGNDGYLEVRIADYAVVATNPRPTAASIERPEAGPLQRVYRWDRIPVGGRVDLVLAVDVQTSLGLLPKAQIGNIVSDPEIGSLVSGAVYAMVQALGLLLLLWLTASTPARAYFRDPARTAASDILTLGLAFAFLPAVAHATTVLGYSVYTWLPALDPVRQAVGQPPDVVGTVALALALLVFAGLAAYAVTTRRLLSRILAALSVAGGLWVFVVVAGRLVVAATDSSASVLAAKSAVAAWVVGAALVLLALAYSRWRFSPLRHALRRLARSSSPSARTPSATGEGGLLDALGRLGPRPMLWPRRSPRVAPLAFIGSAVLAAIALGFPVGRRTPAAEAVGGPEELFDFVIRQFVGLLSYGYALFGLAVVVILVRGAWLATPWDRLVLELRGRTESGAAADGGDPVELLKRTGRAIFAGFVIGTAGVFAVVPLPFFIAFPLFDRLLLRSTAETVELAGHAPAIRAERARLLTESIRKGLAPDEEDPTPAAAPVEVAPAAGSLPSFHVDNVAALGPEDTIWGNVALGLKVGGALTAGLVLLYVGQYSFASVTTEDPYYLQRLGLNVAAFVASWLILGFFFGLMYEHLRGQSGMQKGLLLGAAILVLTLPFQLLSTLASGLPLISITIRVLQVLAFTTSLGVAFDLRLMRRTGRLRIARPRRVLHDLGGMSGSSQVATAVLFIVGSIVGTVGTVLTGQLTQLLTRILTPFLPLPT